MRKAKPVIYISLIAFIAYSLYKVVLIYVLNVESLKSSYVFHSNSIEISKEKKLYIASYQLDKITNRNTAFPDSLVPTIFFVEKEKIIYPQYYFYWGKSELGKRSTMDATSFLALSKSGEYNISCPMSTLPEESENIDKYRKNIYFFFDTALSRIVFLVMKKANNNKTDSLIFKRI